MIINMTSSFKKFYINKQSCWRLFAYGVLIIGAAAMLVPLLWAFVFSFKSYAEIFNNSFFWPKHWVWQNYANVFRSAPFFIYFLNTLKIAFACTFGTVFTSAVAAYAFARLRFPGRDYLFMSPEISFKALAFIKSAKK